MSYRSETDLFGPGSFSSPALPRFGSRFGSFLRQIARWHATYRSRERLAALNDRDLRDIGLTRDQVEAELGKPFWR